MKMPTGATRSEIISVLREQIRRIGGGRPNHEEAMVSTGCEGLDRLFPEKGIRRGALVEWIGDGSGHGAGTMALIAARQACADGGALMVIDRQGRFYPPSAAALGIDVNALVIVRPVNYRDEIWAFDQSLRCEAVSAVWGYLEQLSGRSFRRLQLSAEKGRGVGLLVRSVKSLQEPTWAEVSLHVRPCPSEKSRRFRVEVARCRGGHAGGWGEFEIDERAAVIRGATSSDEASSVHLVSQLARPAIARRPTGT